MKETKKMCQEMLQDRGHRFDSRSLVSLDDREEQKWCLFSTGVEQNTTSGLGASREASLCYSGTLRVRLRGKMAQESFGPNES